MNDQTVSSDVSKLIEHLFRHSYGKMTSRLASILGIGMLSMVEDIVSETLLAAMYNWSYHGIPDNPEGWLYRACRNKAIDFIRKDKTASDYSDRVAEHQKKIEEQFEPALSNEISDDYLKMILYCCHPSLTSQSQIALTLKVVAGFSISEISSAFFEPEGNISQRITRAKRTLKEQDERFEELTPDIISQRFPVVLQVLYLIFNEGYYSQTSDKIIRSDLMLESIRLAELLHPKAGNHQPKLDALIALFYFHTARIPARISSSAEMILLKDQDRKLWNKELINKGFAFLNQAIGGDTMSEYHLHASIAATHCSAESYEKTDWKSILKSYEMLIEMNSSSLLKLNRAIVEAEIYGVEKGLEEIEKCRKESSLESYYLYHAVKGAMLAESNDIENACKSYKKAIELTSSETEKIFLERQLENLAIKD